MTRIYRVVFLGALVFAVMAAAERVSAQQTNFSVSPPPIASPYFNDGESEFKVRGTIVSISGPDISLSGAGADIISRKAFSDEFAGDFQVGLFGISGDIGSGITQESITMTIVQMSANLELQPFKSESASMIIFTGLTLSAASMTGDSFDATMNLTGVQAGMQFGLKAGDFHIDPFFMAVSQSGTSTVSTGYGDFTSDIDPFTTTSFGIDIVYIPANITLSSIIQEASEQGTDSGYDTTIIQFAWSTKF